VTSSLAAFDLARAASLAVPLVFFTYFLGGLVPFFIMVAMRGLPHDEPRIEQRRRSPLLPRWAMYYLLWILAPFERLLVRLQVFPNSVTIASVVMSCGAGVALAYGLFGIGGWLYLLTGILDILDGRVARATRRESSAGALFDSVLDRYAELATFSGLVIYYRNEWVLYATLGLLAGSFMISYARARGEGLGVTGDVGAMQRPERILYLGVALATSPFLVDTLEPGAAQPFYHLAALAIAALAVATNVTAANRFRFILGALRARDGSPPSRNDPSLRSRREDSDTSPAEAAADASLDGRTAATATERPAA
jgi:phosphatidylglycerophosphate synthase